MKKRLQKCTSILGLFSFFFGPENAFAADNGAHGQYGSPPRTNKTTAGKDVSPDSVADDKIYMEREMERKTIPFPSFSLSSNKASHAVETINNQVELAQFKTYLENTAVFNVDGILNRIQVLVNRGLSNIDIGSVLSESADHFSKHDFFAINRFSASSPSSSTSSAIELTDEDLINNWRRWYTYKLLASHYFNAPFNAVDARLGDKFVAEAELAMHRSNPDYLRIKQEGTAFYSQQQDIQGEIELGLMEKGIDCKELVSYISDVYG